MRYQLKTNIFNREGKEAMSSAALELVTALRAVVTSYGGDHSDRGSNTVWQAAWTAPWLTHLSVAQF